MTLKVFEDNVLVREQLETKGKGRVLVVDGGGSMRCALVGGNLGQLAQNMGWAGIIVNGCIRDVDEINGCDIGVSQHIPKNQTEEALGRRTFWCILQERSFTTESGYMQTVAFSFPKLNSLFEVWSFIELY